MNRRRAVSKEIIFQIIIPDERTSVMDIQSSLNNLLDSIKLQEFRKQRYFRDKHRRFLALLAYINHIHDEHTEFINNLPSNTEINAINQYYNRLEIIIRYKTTVLYRERRLSKLSSLSTNYALIVSIIKIECISIRFIKVKFITTNLFTNDQIEHWASSFFNNREISVTDINGTAKDHTPFKLQSVNSVNDRG